MKESQFKSFCFEILKQFKIDRVFTPNETENEAYHTTLGFLKGQAERMDYLDRTLKEALRDNIELKYKQQQENLFS